MAVLISLHNFCRMQLYHRARLGAASLTWLAKKNNSKFHVNVAQDKDHNAGSRICPCSQHCQGHGNAF